ncbi:MAG TPA: hypothetical protein VGI17_02730 [Solirubrobacterales bacterium]|jgi:hypothetical protein
MSGVSGVTAAVMQAAVPAEVREEGSAAVSSYRAALQFESMLLKQMLSEALPESPTGSTEEGGEEGAAFTAMPTAVSLPETVAEAVVGAGGLGLAEEMYGSFQGAGK